MFKPSWLAFAALLLAQPAFAAYDQAPNHYRLTISQDAQRAHVDADVWIEGKDLVLFNSMPIPQLKNGQADMLEKIVVTDMAGKPIALKDKGEGEYELDGNRRVKLSYDIRLDHGKYEWPGGNEEVFYRTDEGFLSSGYNLFLVPGEKMLGKTEVTVQLPTGWHLNTPWAPGAKPNTYTAETRRELVNNVMFFGTAKSEEFTSGGVKFKLVMGKRYWSQSKMIKDVIDRQLKSYLAMFGKPPVADRFLLIFNQGDTGDGGAFAGSFSQFLKGDADKASRVIWGRVVSHELLHFWNGHSLRPEREEEEWFKEGVTDYLTVMTMARNGFLDREFVLQHLQNMARGQHVARNLMGLKGTVQAAVKDKHRNWLLVYGGGTIAALAMDLELRRATNDKFGIEDLMKALFAEFGKPGKTYTHDDILRVGKQLAGIDMGPMLDKLVKSETVPDLGPLFSQVGMQIEQWGMLETHVLRKQNATAAERKRFTALFGIPY
jgi:predicted metalloprotease with PDZ domain